MIAIVDYGMGNLRSVEKGFAKVGVDARVTSIPSVVDDASAVVLPGVGAFRDCIRNLTDLSLTGAVIRAIQKGKPFLGICLGLQVLFSESEEFGSCKGLDIFRGRVMRFRIDEKVPHMGWNTVRLVNRPPIFGDIPDNAYFYFVHSFYVSPDDAGVNAGLTDYGVTFTSMVWKDNVFATQFHPEKSQALGLKILKGFGDFVGKS
ncbi:MAG: imidazole glycerol phosphate synthase subunit HisH [Nitrospiraceae bacterium]|nr:imidazole glycerol phosphate synthase subunit HisH [Nitrospiraceae bacterium]